MIKNLKDETVTFKWDGKVYQLEAEKTFSLPETVETDEKLVLQIENKICANNLGKLEYVSCETVAKEQVVVPKATEETVQDESKSVKKATNKKSGK